MDSESQKALRDLNDKIDSIHGRMDRFFGWASCLQVEFRNIQQRLKFIESHCEMDFGVCSQCELNERLETIKKGDS